MNQTTPPDEAEEILIELVWQITSYDRDYLVDHFDDSKLAEALAKLNNLRVRDRLEEATWAHDNRMNHEALDERRSALQSQLTVRENRHG